MLLDAIKQVAPDGTEDPLSDPETLGSAVKIGLLDAPHLKGSEIARGAMVTKVINGACYTVDPHTKKSISEQDRIRRILDDFVKLSDG